MSYSPLLTMMTRAAYKASKGLLRDFGEVDKLQVSKKGVANFVTSADLRTERILIEELQRARPNFGFVTEESGEIAGSDPDHRFVIDPIDGTTNFIHAVPYFCVAVALETRNRAGEFDVTAGLIFDPVHDEMFTAEAGKGAFLNERRIMVSQRREDFLLGTAAPRKGRKHYREAVETLEHVTDAGATVRCSGAAALDLAYIAAGRLDGVWYHALQRWDVAAGIVLVREAGGTVSEIAGGAGMLDSGNVLASNGHIHAKLQKMLLEKAA